METQYLPIFLRYGGANKTVFEMSAEEINVAATSILRRAKERAFSKGRPILFARDGKVYEEWPDGSIIERK
jgi:hypothetical protein